MSFKSKCDLCNDETRGMVDEKFLSLMKKDAFLVNTARGDLVDNEALKNAIVNGTILGAALDTVYPEPTTKDNPLLNHSCLLQLKNYIH